MSITNDHRSKAFVVGVDRSSLVECREEVSRPSGCLLSGVEGSLLDNPPLILNFTQSGLCRGDAILHAICVGLMNRVGRGLMAGWSDNFIGETSLQYVG